MGTILVFLLVNLNDKLRLLSLHILGHLIRLELNFTLKLYERFVFINKNLQVSITVYHRHLALDLLSLLKYRLSHLALMLQELLEAILHKINPRFFSLL
jgi:hypothetical protein